MLFCMHEGGALFTWGRNTHGQLGVGSQDPLISNPQLVKGLQGIPLAQIAAGGAHSVVVSLSGAVYSWGKNNFGQLGLGHTEGMKRKQFESSRKTDDFFHRHRNGSGMLRLFGTAVGSRDLGRKYSWISFFF